MLVSGDFIAQGGEKFITIGNFKDDSQTTLDSTPGALQPFGYYFIDDISVTDCTVGITEIEKTKFTLSPNPVKDVLNINLDFSRAQDFTLQVTDILGSAVIQKNYKAGIKPKEIDVSILTSGVYFISLKTQREVYTQKFVKE